MAGDSRQGNLPAVREPPARSWWRRWGWLVRWGGTAAGVAYVVRLIHVKNVQAAFSAVVGRFSSAASRM